MYGKEVSKRLRQGFCTIFGKSFPRKRILYNTKLKGISFKCHFDPKQAFISLDVEDKLENRANSWGKLMDLKSVLI